MAQRVLILTPVKDAAHHLDRYVAGLDRLTYPRAALSLGLLESDSRDSTFELLSSRLPRLRERFRRVTLLQHTFDFHMPPGVPRWAASHQLKRRTVLARSRNRLLSGALRDEDWVLWLDVDVVDYPPDVIERLLATGRELVTPALRRNAGRAYLRPQRVAPRRPAAPRRRARRAGSRAARRRGRE
jgi:hypothetical protein